MDGEKRPAWIEGAGWRYETEHRATRRHHSHHYNDKGTYLITLVVNGRKPLLGHIVGDVRAAKGSALYPHIKLSILGEHIKNEELPKINHYYPMAEVWQLCLMPDHVHMILRINDKLPKGKHLGQIIRGFKTGCTRNWWQLQDQGVMPLVGEATSTRAKINTGLSCGPNSPVSAASPSEPLRRLVLFESGYND